MTEKNRDALSIDKSSWKKTAFGDVVIEPKESVKDPLTEGVSHVVGLEHIDSEDIHLRRSASLEEGTTFTKKFSKGDVLFGRRRAYLKKAAKAEFEGICSGDITVLRARQEVLNPGLLPYIVNNDKFFDYAIEHSAGGLSPRVKFKDLIGFQVEIPCKQSQCQILDLFDSADECSLAYLRHHEALLKLYWSAREKYCFQFGGSSSVYNSKLKSDVDGSVKFIPMEKRLESIKYGTSKKSNSDDLGYPVLGIPNVINEKLNLDNVAHVVLEDREYDSCKLEYGDIVIVRTNGNPDYTGRSALYDLDHGHVYASYLIKIAINKEQIDPEFLVRYLQTKNVRRYFRRHATSSAGNYNINTETIKSLPIPEVNMDKQREIVKILKDLEVSVNDSDCCISEFKNLIKGITAQVF